MTCGVCHDILKLLQTVTAIPWTPQERAAAVARAQASIAESERAMLLRMPVQTDFVQ